MPRKGKRRSVAKTSYSDAHGLEAVVRVTVDGVEIPKSKRYPRDTPIKEIRNWQLDTARELRKLTGVTSKNNFEADVPSTWRS